MATVMVYSDDEKVRERVRLAVGRTPDQEIGPLTWIDAADVHEFSRDVLSADVVILDGESQPAGGIGVARQLKAEHADGPPTVLIIARKDDRWLARWSLADAVIAMPIDPPELTEAVVRLLRERLAKPPAEPVRGRFGAFKKAR